jgi:hypothetical protein
MCMYVAWAFVPDAINFTIKYMYMMGGGWSVLWA